GIATGWARSSTDKRLRTISSACRCSTAYRPGGGHTGESESHHQAPRGSQRMAVLQENGPVAAALAEPEAAGCPDPARPETRGDMDCDQGLCWLGARRRTH